METQSLEKSQRINLGAGNLKFSENTLRKINYSLSVLFLIMACLYIFRSGIGLFEKIVMSGLYLFTGLLFFLKAQIEFSKTSKYAPHFIISANGIHLKTGTYRKSEFFNWNEIKKIELGNFKIGIKSKSGWQHFPYNTRPETSIELKRSIAAMATQKNVEVMNLLKR